MNLKDFRCPEAGKLVPTTGGHWAFVPAPLPAELHYDTALTLALSRADAALSELAGLGRVLPNPHLLIAPYIRREAVLSSRIQRLKSLPLSLRLVRELHARLMKGVRGEHAAAGEFRRAQNWIGPTGSTLATAAYVPPPPQEMQAALGEWEKFIHQHDAMPDLVQCALLHEQFEAIHPFLDGNGRVGRLLITLYLMERARLPQPLLYLSAYIEEHRRDYYELLQRVRTDCDWNAWLRFFLAGVETTAKDAVLRARCLTDLREKIRTRFAGKPKVLALLDQLFINPYISVARAEKILGVSNPTARQAVVMLEKAGVLKEVSGRAWGKLYLAGAILDAVQS